MPIQSVGLLQACVPICMSGPSCKAAKPRSTPSANSFFTDGSCNSSPVLINIADDHLPRNQLPNHEIAFNIHTSQADHRDRGKRLRLPSCLLIETASNDAPAHPVAPCSRRFRCRLATIRPEPAILAPLLWMTTKSRNSRLFHSRTISPKRVTRRMVPSRRIAAAIWKLGLLKGLSFLPSRFNVREY